MGELSQEYGPIYRLTLPGFTTLIVTGHKLVKEVCDITRFDKEVSGVLENVRAFAGDGLFTSKTTATLVLGMILQHFKLIDYANYQLKVQQTLTIKPDDFTIRVQVRPDKKVASMTYKETGERENEKAPKQKTLQASAMAEAKGVPLLILYGSNLGATASYNGRPPRNAAGFVKWLEQAGPGELQGVQYAVLGCGDRNWSNTYQSVPVFIDEQLALKGGKRLSPRGEADAGGISRSRSTTGVRSCGTI